VFKANQVLLTETTSGAAKQADATRSEWTVTLWEVGEGNQGQQRVG